MLRKTAGLKMLNMLVGRTIRRELERKAILLLSIGEIHMIRTCLLFKWLAVIAAFAFVPHAILAVGPVTTESLLNEMIDRDALARFPQSDFRLRRLGVKRWSGASHLFVRARKVGDFVEVRFPVEGDGPFKLVLHATQSYDYGILRLTVNGQPAGEDIDTYAKQPAPLAPVELGVFKLVDSTFTLRAEVVGKNSQSQKTGAYFGLDCIVVQS